MISSCCFFYLPCETKELCFGLMILISSFIIRIRGEWASFALRPCGDALLEAVFITESGSRGRLRFGLAPGSCTSARSCLCLHGNRWGEWRAFLGYGNREETAKSHTSERIQSCFWYLWQELLAEAAVPEPTLAQDTGNEEMGPLSYVITGAQPAECMFVHAYMCVSVCKTDRPTVDPPTVCMIYPILYPATLCKHQLSGPQSHWQEKNRTQWWWLYILL